MKRRMSYWLLGLSLVVIAVLVFANEKMGWIAPEKAMKVKNPIKPTKASVEKGKEIYDKKCALCHGIKGDGKGPVSEGLNPNPANFKEHHGQMTDGEHFWKMTTGRGAMPSFEKDMTGEERWHVINYINTFMKHK